MLAADIARGNTRADESTQAAHEGIRKLEATLQELEARRSILIARARDADARLAIERALMEVDAEPAQVALDLVAERVTETQAEAEAVAEVRQVSEEVQGGGNA